MSDPESTGASSASAPVSERRVRRLAVVLNGSAKNVTEAVIEHVRAAIPPEDLYVSRSLDDAKAIAQLLVERDYDSVLAGGGDGTFTVTVTDVVRVADACGKQRPRFGYLKLGTGNALAHVVGATESRGLAADIRRLKEDAGVRELGLVEVEDTLAPFCGFGIDAVVLQDYQKVKSRLAKTPLKGVAAGPLSYAISAVTRTLPRYLFRSAPHCTVVNLGKDAYRIGENGRATGKPIGEGEVLYEGPALIAAAGTIPYYGYGFRMFPFTEELNDRMNLRISTLGPADFVKHLGAIWKGEHVDPTKIFDFLVDDVRVQMEPATAFQIGGDVVGSRESIRLRLSERPVEVIDFYSPPSVAPRAPMSTLVSG